MSEMYEDGFREEYGEHEYANFVACQKKLEAMSEWITGVRGMQVTALADPMSVEERYNDPTNRIGKDILLDTADNSGLILNAEGVSECLRQCALPSLLGTSGIGGTGIGRVTKHFLAIGISAFLTAARSESQILKRAGKVASVVSMQYEYMPPSELLEICEKLENQFGKPEFIGGSISHDLTTAKFRFPEAAPDVTAAYNKLLIAAGKPATAQLTPVVEFRTSDTSGEAARLITYLQDSTASMYSLIPLGEGVKVVHTPPDETGANGRKTCMEKFEEEAATLYAKTGAEIQTLIPAMLNTHIRYPANSLIGLCKSNRIPQKWGGLVEEDVRDIYGQQGCTFLDLYLLLTEVTSHAVNEGNSPQSKRIIELEEILSKIARSPHKWTQYDKPGTVSWS